MISYSFNNLSKSTFFYAGVKRDIFNNLTSTPFLLCNRNSFYVIDVLFYMNSLKKILYLIQALAVKKQQFLILYGDGISASSYFKKKLGLFNKNIVDFNKKRYSFFIKHSDLNLKYFLYKFLKKQFVFSSNFYKMSKVYRKPFRFFRGKSKRDFVLTKRSLLFKLYPFLNKILLNFKTVGTYARKSPRRLSALNLLFFFDFLFFLDIFKFKSLLGSTVVMKYLSSLDLYIFCKNTNLRLSFYFFNFKRIYNITIKYNNALNSSLFVRDQVLKAINVNKVDKLFLLKKKISFIYKRNIKTMVFVKKMINVFVYRHSIKFLLSREKQKHFFKKLMRIYAFLREQNRSLRFFKHRNFLYSYYTKKISFGKRPLNFGLNIYTDSWINGSLTNFYGIKENNLRFLNFPDIFLFISMSNYEGFLKEINYLDLFLLGFLDLYKDFNYVQYYLPTNSSSKDLNLFYFNLVIESVFRGFLSDLHGYSRL